MIQIGEFIIPLCEIEYIEKNKLYTEEYDTYKGYKYIKSVDDISARQYIIDTLDKEVN